MALQFTARERDIERDTDFGIVEGFCSRQHAKDWADRYGGRAALENSYRMTSSDAPIVVNVQRGNWHAFESGCFEAGHSGCCENPMHFHAPRQAA